MRAGSCAEIDGFRLPFFLGNVDSFIRGGGSQAKKESRNQELQISCPPPLRFVVQVLQRSGAGGAHQAEGSQEPTVGPSFPSRDCSRLHSPVHQSAPSPPESVQVLRRTALCQQHRPRPRETRNHDPVSMDTRLRHPWWDKTTREVQNATRTRCHRGRIPKDPCQLLWDAGGGQQKP